MIPVRSAPPKADAGAEPLPDLGRVGVDVTEQRTLSLREAIEMTLGNNRDIEIARQDVKMAEFDLEGARGVYDARLSSFAFYEKTETPVTSFLSGGVDGAVSQSGFTGAARLEKLSTRFGGSYHIDFSTSRSTSNNQFLALNPFYTTALTVNYTQPVWRGRSFDNNRRLIEIAKKNLQLSDAQFRQRTIDIITDVEHVYWDLVFTLRNLQVQRDAVRDARAQLQHNKRLVEQGQLAPVDVVAVEAQVSGFEQSFYGALEEVSRTENALKNLIAENRRAPIWNASLLPTDAVELRAPTITLSAAVEAALANRPELQQLNTGREINAIDRRYYREQLKPQVDLQMSYGTVGLAGSLSDRRDQNPLTSTTAQLRGRINTLSQLNGLPPLPEVSSSAITDNLIGGYGQGLTNLAANRFNNFRVGVQISLPLRNRTARAQLGRALAEGERITARRDQLEQLIQVDMRNALQSVRSAESCLRTAAATRASSEQQFVSEQRKFDAGRSTVFLVLERQTALTSARSNELRAQTDLNKAIVELRRAMGSTMEANSVVARLR